MFELNNNATSVGGSISPSTQVWEDMQVGTDHVGGPIYSSYKPATLGFDSCTLDAYKVWLEAASTGTSLTSITILDQASLNYRKFIGTATNPIFLTLRQRPKIETGIARGPWTVVVTGLQP